MSTFSKTQRLAFALAVPVVLLGSAAAAVVVFRPPLPWASAQTQTQSSGCTFLSSPNSSPAFCDTFDQPAGTGNRSGDLNGTVWGVSRTSGNQNTGLANQWSPATLNLCGTSAAVAPEGDVRICNGHVAEATTDGGTVTSLAMYVKQPFDIAGRTGTVSFDVSDDTQGTHSAWPEFWYSDRPVPTPFQHEGSFLSVPQNGLGVRFGAMCTPGQGANCGPNCPNSNNQPVFTVDSADVVNNYVPNDSFNGGSLSVVRDNCVIEGSAAAGTMNHIELRISTTQTDVFATDAFTPGSALPSLKHLATINGDNLTLTRGLTWIEDAHYNGNKFNTEGTHTFYWDNFGFDGPVLPQDRAFDVLDNHAPNGDGTTQTGWWIGPSSRQTLTTLPIDSTALSNATAALLTYNFWSEQAGFTLNVNINGHAHSIPYPFSGNRSFSPDSYALAIPTSDLVTGPNTITFSTDGSFGVNVFNIDLVAVGGGGSAGGSSTPAPNPTATAAATATGTTPASATPTSAPINNVPCTVTINGVQQTGTCTGTFAP